MIREVVMDRIHPAALSNSGNTYCLFIITFPRHHVKRFTAILLDIAAICVLFFILS